MRKKQFILSLLAVILAITIHAQAQKSGNSGSISTFSDFESAMPPVRYIDNPIMKHGGWAGGQLEEPCI